MTFKTHEITVDLVNATPTKELRFSQGDRNSAKFVLNITNEGQELDLSKAKAVRITFKKSDGTTVFQQDCQVINALKGKYQIVLKTQTLAAVGNVYAQVRIFEDDRELDAEPFVFTVKQSYSGDAAVESTNEFTIIQKAIEAGKKLEGVNIDGIIAAGAKADAALPKTGGTMTGNLIVGAGGKGLMWNHGTEMDMGIVSTVDGKQLYMKDWKRDRVLWSNDDNGYNVFAANLLKKGGDTMTGNMKIDRPSGASYRWLTWSTGGVDDMSLGLTASGTFMLQDVKGSRTVLSYDPATKVLTQYGESNLLKNTGGAVTGNLVMSNDRGIFYQNKAGSSVLAHKLDVTDVFSLRDVVNGRNVYTVSGNDFIVNYNLKTAKDGQADFVVTADGTAFDAGTPNVARRRGNTVTLRIALRRNVGSTDSIVATIPADMRPSTFMVTNAVATDGTVVRLTVEAAGNVKLSAPGKDVYATMTYVVD